MGLFCVYNTLLSASQHSVMVYFAYTSSLTPVRMTGFGRVGCAQSTLLAVQGMKLQIVTKLNFSKFMKFVTIVYPVPDMHAGLDRMPTRAVRACMH